MPDQSSATRIDYIGDELQLFSHARNWKSYFAAQISPFIKGDVVEVGAGLGGTTEVLCSGQESSWTCIEPDPNLCQQISDKVLAGTLPRNVTASRSVLSDRPIAETFDTALYIDVLEHIRDDRTEALAAARRLRTGGNLIVLAPAHQSLFTPFDAAIGHYRRYDRKTLTAISPDGLELRKCFYLDSIGLLASLSNKLLLKQAHPKLGQILFWDRAMVPISRIVDPLVGRNLGKTVIAIWHKPHLRTQT